MNKIKKGLKSILRFSFVLSVLISAYVFVMFQGGLVSWTIFYAILPFIIYSLLLFFYPLGRLKATREVQTKNIQSGGKLSVVITVRRNFRFPLLYVVISERWHDEELVEFATGHTSEFIIWGFRKEFVWQYELDNMPRGEYLSEGVDIEIIDFFGWLRRKKFIPIENKILVYPKVVDLKYLSLGRQSEYGAASSLFNIVKDATMVTGVRSYEAGDRVSWIHWKSFARTGELMTKEFEDSRSEELRLILDSRVSDMFEEQIVLVASILKVSMSHQTGIGFMSIPSGSLEGDSKQTSFPFLQTEAQYRRVFAHLARIKPVSENVVDRSINDHSLFIKSGITIVITGNPDWRFLQSVISSSLSASSVICFVVVGKEFARRKELMKNVELTKQKGFNVQVITPAQFSDAFREVAVS